MTERLKYKICAWLKERKKEEVSEKRRKVDVVQLLFSSSVFKEVSPLREFGGS